MGGRMKSNQVEQKCFKVLTLLILFLLILYLICFFNNLHCICIVCKIFKDNKSDHHTQRVQFPLPYALILCSMKGPRSDQNEISICMYLKSGFAMKQNCNSQDFKTFKLSMKMIYVEKPSWGL